jgi:hypothetical protein
MFFRGLLGRDDRHLVRSAGTASCAPRRLTTREIAWAEVVAVMEEAHLNLIQGHWPDHAKKVVVLRVCQTTTRQMSPSFVLFSLRSYTFSWRISTATPPVLGDHLWAFGRPPRGNEWRCPTKLAGLGGVREQ